MLQKLSLVIFEAGLALLRRSIGFATTTVASSGSKLAFEHVFVTEQSPMQYFHPKTNQCHCCHTVYIIHFPRVSSTPQ